MFEKGQEVKINWEEVNTPRKYVNLSKGRYDKFTYRAKYREGRHGPRHVINKWRNDHIVSHCWVYEKDLIAFTPREKEILKHYNV